MNRNIIIIGGGVIGLTTSLYLTRNGFKVTIIEKKKKGYEASSKNAGLIVPSMFNPICLSFNYLKLIKWFV